MIGGFALPGLVIALAGLLDCEARGWSARSADPPLLVGAYALHFGTLALGPARVAAWYARAWTTPPVPSAGGASPGWRRSACR